MSHGGQVPMFETIVDEVIASVHQSIKEDTKVNAQIDLKKSNLKSKPIAKPGITEEEFEAHRDELKKYLQKKLNKLLQAKCNDEFLKKYIKYSGRSYIRHYTFGAQTRYGNEQLMKFLEAKIIDTFENETNSIVKANLRSYLRSSELVDPSLASENQNEKAEIEEISEELKNFLRTRYVQRFWECLTNPEAKKKKAEKLKILQQKTSIDLVETTKQDEKNNAALGIPKISLSNDHFKENCNWYKYKLKDDPLNIIQEIDKKCEFYIRNRYEKLKKLEAQLPKECELKIKDGLINNSNGALYVDEENKIKMPTVYKIEAKGLETNKNSLIDELTTVTEQYNKMQELRLMLYKSDLKYSEKIALFREAYINSENQKILTKDIDGALKKVLFAISNLLSGQFFRRGTWRFWRTDPELIGEIVSGYAPLKPVEEKTKVLSLHNEASPRRGR